jgi:hypothetical protein
MKAVATLNEKSELKGGGDIPIPSPLREILQSTDKHQLVQMFQNLRLDLQSRISNLDDRELVKLQGKLDYLNELEIFFTTLLK